MDDSIDFDGTWKDYQQGFGNLSGDFFLGLDKIHAITQSKPHELWIEMEDFRNNRRSANYSDFAIGNAEELYKLNMLGYFTGNAGDSMTYHKGMKFTTKDRDNDKRDHRNCAQDLTGGWWYKNCYHSHLTGRNLRGSYGENNMGKGIAWSSWHGNQYSLKYVHMAIRPVK